MDSEKELKISFIGKKKPKQNGNKTEMRKSEKETEKKKQGSDFSHYL